MAMAELMSENRYPLHHVRVDPLDQAEAKPQRRHPRHGNHLEDEDVEGVEPVHDHGGPASLAATTRPPNANRREELTHAVA